MQLMRVARPSAVRAGECALHYWPAAGGAAARGSTCSISATCSCLAGARGQGESIVPVSAMIYVVDNFAPLNSSRARRSCISSTSWRDLRRWCSRIADLLCDVAQCAQDRASRPIVSRRSCSRRRWSSCASRRACRRSIRAAAPASPLASSGSSAHCCRQSLTSNVA
jgi:hypothetical protein